MKLYYSSKKLEKNLTTDRLRQKNYTNIYKKLTLRLSELQAANNLDEIPSDPPPRRHKLDGDKKNCWGIDCSKNYRIIIKPAGNYNINDLTTITEITILDIEDYHNN